MDGGAFCVSHDPAKIADLAEWRLRGGRAKSSKARAAKALPDHALAPAELQGLLGLTLKAVLNERKSPAIGNAVGSLARAIVAVREATTVEERLTALEAAAGLHDPRRRA